MLFACFDCCFGCWCRTGKLHCIWQWPLNGWMWSRFCWTKRAQIRFWSTWKTERHWIWRRAKQCTTSSEQVHTRLLTSADADAVAVRKKSTISLSGARPVVAVAPGSPRQLASSLDTKAPPSPKLGLPLKHVASDGCASLAGSHSLLGLSSPSAASSGPLSPSLSRASAVLSEAKLQPGRELRHVAQKGFVDEVKRVCTTTEVDVDEPDDKGWTALTYAADAGHLAVVMYLIAKAGEC